MLTYSLRNSYFPYGYTTVIETTDATTNPHIAEPLRSTTQGTAIANGQDQEIWEAETTTADTILDRGVEVLGRDVAPPGRTYKPTRNMAQTRNRNCASAFWRF